LSHDDSMTSLELTMQRQCCLLSVVKTWHLSDGTLIFGHTLQ